MSLTSADLRGLVPAGVLPMTPDGTIVEEGLRRYVRWLADQGPVALAYNVDTGEGGHLAPEERLRVIEIIKEETSVPVVAGLHGPYTARAVQEAKDLAAAGADAFLVFPLVAYQSKPLEPEIPIGYHRAIAEVGVPIVLFQLQEALAGVMFGEEILKGLLQIDEVVAIKEASFDAMIFRQTVRVVRDTRPEITVLTGNDNFMRESMMLGGDGGLLGFAAMMTQEMSDMISTWHAGDLERNRVLGERTQKMADVIFATPVSGYRARLKEALVMLGVFEPEWANVRRPLLPVPDHEREGIRKALQELELL